MAMFRRGIFYFFLSIYLKEFLGVSNTEMTLFATLPMIANIFSQSAIWGRISDKYKKRRLLIIFGELYAAVGYLVVFFIHRQAGINNSLRAAAFTIIIGFTVIEAGWSSSNLGWTTLIADLTKESERSRIMGLLQFVGGIGNVLGVTASGFLYKSGLGFWQGDLFYISSGIMVFSIIALLMIPESYADLDPEYFDKDKEGSNPSELELRDKKNLNSKWPWKLFIWLLVILAITNIGGNSINQLLNIHIRLPETFAASDVVVAQLRNTSSISMIIAGLVIGFLVSRFGDGKMLLVAFILAFVANIAIPFAPHIVIFFIYMALKGTARVWTQTTAYSMVNRVVPLEKRGKMMGYYNATFYLSWGLGGTILTGPIADAVVVRSITIIAIYIALAIIFIGLWLYIIVNRVLRIGLKGKFVLIIGAALLVGLVLAASFSSTILAKMLIWFGTAVALLTRSFNAIWMSPGNPDSYAYIITFFVAAFLVLIGILTYILYRPKNYDLLIIDRNAMVKSIEVKS
jgi:MFS family permease